MEDAIIGILVIVVVVFSIVIIWKNSLGPNPYFPYSSKPSFLKYFSYTLWNMVAFFSFGKMKRKSYKEEFNQKLKNKGLDRFIY
tara:strand:- start:162 stop:413 length:252 start_codon:yes stop_codon:yes gene_type:complete